MQLHMVHEYLVFDCKQELYNQIDTEGEAYNSLLNRKIINWKKHQSYEGKKTVKVDGKGQEGKT